MSLAQEDPARAIRNALDRLALAAANTELELHVAAERALIEEALGRLGAPPLAPAGERLRRCPVCAFEYGGEETCPRCDLFGR